MQQILTNYNHIYKYVIFLWYYNVSQPGSPLFSVSWKHLFCHLCFLQWVAVLACGVSICSACVIKLLRMFSEADFTETGFGYVLDRV